MTDKTAQEIENEALARRIMDRIERDGCVHLSAVVEEIAFARGIWNPPTEQRRSTEDFYRKVMERKTQDEQKRRDAELSAKMWEAIAATTKQIWPPRPTEQVPIVQEWNIAEMERISVGTTAKRSNDEVKEQWLDRWFAKFVAEVEGDEE